jgi:hypothetical protein
MIWHGVCISWALIIFWWFNQVMTYPQAFASRRFSGMKGYAAVISFCRHAGICHWRVYYRTSLPAVSTVSATLANRNILGSRQASKRRSSAWEAGSTQQGDGNRPQRRRFVPLGLQFRRWWCSATDLDSLFWWCIETLHTGLPRSRLSWPALTKFCL